MKQCILLLVLVSAFVLGAGNDGKSFKYGILPEQTVNLESSVAPAPNLYEPWYSIPVLSGLLHIEPMQAQILLFSNRNSYASALQAAGIPLKEIPDYVTKSGGVTIGRDIWIPLFAWPDSSGLAYTLTHELSHLALAENRLVLPAWMNEGLAWDAGWSVQEEMNPKLIEEYNDRYFEELKEVAVNGQLLPLNVEEQDILKAPYNVEWQDYVAVECLLNTYGKNALDSFLNQSKKIGSAKSFENCFGASLSAYEKRFNQGLAEQNKVNDHA